MIFIPSRIGHVQGFAICHQGAALCGTESANFDVLAVFEGFWAYQVVYKGTMVHMDGWRPSRQCMVWSLQTFAHRRCRRSGLRSLRQTFAHGRCMQKAHRARRRAKPLPSYLSTWYQSDPSSGGEAPPSSRFATSIWATLLLMFFGAKVVLNIKTGQRGSLD